MVAPVFELVTTPTAGLTSLAEGGESSFLASSRDDVQVIEDT